MKSIYNTSELVEDALINDPKLRDDDNLLYIHICKRINPIVIGMNFETVLTNRAHMGIPSMETVGRCRRKIQETHPNLRSSKKVEDARYEHYKEVMEYASN